jgi:DNA-binding response OmpR family regulator
MRILVIEDDADIRSMLALHLKAASFAVDVIDCGEKGSYLARTNDYDLIIMDYILPKKEGPQICKEIRDSGKTTPIMMLSVRSTTYDKVTLLNLGADDYLHKPFSFEELNARIKALLRRPRDITHPVVTISDITIDSDKQLVTRGRKSIYLTRKEFSLLEYLARHQGMVVSRGMIMEHVWDLDSDPFSNTIEAHILNLRKKLGQKKQKVIYTVPGRGYKLDTKV